MISPISLGIQDNNQNIKNFYTMKDEYNLDRRKNITMGDKKFISKKNKNISNDYRKSFDVINNKRKKKQKELDIISLNIQKSSQNLNQPDIFYAGLFSQLINENKEKNKSSSSSPKTWNNHISERDENQEQESQNYYLEGNNLELNN